MSPPPVTPADFASDVWADSWPMLLDLLKSTSGLFITAALTLYAIGWVVAAVKKGRPPSLDEREFAAWSERERKKKKRAGGDGTLTEADWDRYNDWADRRKMSRELRAVDRERRKASSR